MTKVTKKQAHVLQLMNEGWELGVSSSLTSHIWLQQDGLGRGGNTEGVHTNTFKGLYTRRLIKQKTRSFPTRLWGLTEAGIAAAKT